MREQFSRYGGPDEVVSDEGTNIMRIEMKQFSKDYGFKLSPSSAYHQQVNGKAESSVKIAKSIIKKSDDYHKDFWWAL